MKINKTGGILLIFLALAPLLFLLPYKKGMLKKVAIGQPVDSLNGVYVFYNGGGGNVSGRNIAGDGYNLGLKYQCVEFVKRYYYENYKHKMPDSYGHAKDFFDCDIGDGQLNGRRNLIQYTNPGNSKPQPGDLLVFSATAFNKFGHVAIVSAVSGREIEIIQQNPGPSGKTRETYGMNMRNGKWKIENKRILGWLRKE